jgi:tRNA(His) 5'-end guanylyltransferase
MRDSLGDRMKTYEKASRTYLTRRTPVIVRLDGAHYHSFTRGFHKPFDDVLINAMQLTMLDLCKNIQNCVLGYTQSDEISLVLCDYKKRDTSAWFDNQVQKICSTSAALATIFFNKHFEAMINCFSKGDREIYEKALKKNPTFDSRCFNLPKEEVCNYLIWRQQDAARNSIQMAAQSMFSHKELQGLSCNDLQNLMFTERNFNWNTLPCEKRRGSCAIKIFNGWWIDGNIPIFTENRDYVESRIVFDGDD